MLRSIALFLALMLCITASPGFAQEFHNFRPIGGTLPSGSGFVTGISLPSDRDNAQLSFLNVAGLSKVYDIRFTESDVIRDVVPVFLPPPGFSDTQLPALDLQGIDFLKGSLVDPDGGELPPHWFRMTRYNGQWSGMFRIADRIYSINRHSNLVEVRHTPSANTLFQPGRRVKVSAVIDEEYLLAEDSNSPAQLKALESIHTMDGLLADTLNMTVFLEQVIYQPASVLTSSAQVHDLLAGGTNWLSSNSNAFGLTDNLAILFFRAATNATENIAPHPENGLVNDTMILQGSSPDYQLTTAYYFGKLLGIADEPVTLQDWADNGDVALASAHWSTRQQELLDFNPPAADLTQILSYDTPLIATPAPEVIDEVDRQLVDSDSPEGGHQNDPLLSDGEPTTESDNAAGGGSTSLDCISFLVLFFCISLTSRRGRLLSPVSLDKRTETRHR